MSTQKTKVSPVAAKKFLHRHFGTTVQKFKIITAGEISQAFSFSVKRHDYILRVSWKNDAFGKDLFAFKNFRSSSVAIPAIKNLKKFNTTLQASISDKIPGKILDEFSSAELEKLTPSLLDVLHHIHMTDISQYSGYGLWDASGRAPENSWKNYLQKLPGHFSYVAEHLDGDELLNITIIKKILQRYTPLVRYCPEHRHLIHGDFGFNNVLSDGEMITGILDWELSRYGDFLYDIAWLAFWGIDLDYAEAARVYYKKLKLSVPHYEQRLLCYMLHFGLESLHFFSQSQQREKYLWTEKRLLSLL